jgi:hypothetical protein
VDDRLRRRLTEAVDLALAGDWQAAHLRCGRGGDAPLSIDAELREIRRELDRDPR